MHGPVRGLRPWRRLLRKCWSEAVARFSAPTGLELPNPVTVAPELRPVLAQVTDPRKPRGVRHGLVVVLATAVCAVAAGVRSFVAIADGSPTCPLPWPSIWAPRSAARASRRSAGWCRTSTPIGSTPPSPPSSSNGAPRSRPRAGCARWPSMRRQLAGLPWREVEPAHRSAETVHGRREIRTTRVVTIAAGIAFPHAVQAIQIVRRTRPVSARTGKAGRWRTETVYAITDLRPTRQARPTWPDGSAGTGRSRMPCTGSGT